MSNIEYEVACAQLKLHVEVPDLDETWLDGYESGLYEKPEESNPYQMGTSEYEAWTEGWWAGFYKEEPLFNTDGSVNQQALVVEPTIETQQATEKKVATRKYIIKAVEIFSIFAAAAVAYQLSDMLMA